MNLELEAGFASTDGAKLLPRFQRNPDEGRAPAVRCGAEDGYPTFRARGFTDEVSCAGLPSVAPGTLIVHGELVAVDSRENDHRGGLRAHSSRIVPSVFLIYPRSTFSHFLAIRGRARLPAVSRECGCF